MISRLEYVLSETFISMRRHPMMAFAATTCIAATLFVAGIVGLALLGADRAVDKALDSVRFVVFFNPQQSRHETWSAYKQIKQLEGVNPVNTEFRPKEKYWENTKREDPRYAELIERNPLPDAVAVQPTDVKLIPQLKSDILQWPGVIEVADAPDVTTFLLSVRDFVSRIGSALAIILLFLSLVIVHHTIELTLYARRKEINIMSLVGASPSTVAAPFLLEGVVYGIIGGAISFGFLYVLYSFFTSMILTQFGSSIFQSPDLLGQGIAALAGAGIFLGLIGSTISVVKYLHHPRSKVTNA